MQKAQTVIFYDDEPCPSLFQGDIAIVREGNVFKFSYKCEGEFEVLESSVTYDAVENEWSKE